MKLKILLNRLFILTALLLTGCSQSQMLPQATLPSFQNNNPTEIRIGFSSPFSGESAYYGEAAREGAELALEEINTAGGVKGLPLKIIYRDDQNDPAQALKVLEQFISEDKVPLVIGINSSSVTLGICRKAEENKIVLYSIGSNPKIGPACGLYTFQLQGNDLEQGQTLVKIAQYLKVQKTALVYQKNDYGIGNRNAFLNSASEMKLQVLADIPLPQGTQNYAKEIEQLKALAPPMIALIAYGPEGADFLRQAQQADLKAQMVGDTNWGDPAAYNLAGSALDGMIGLQAGAHQSPQYQKYARAFEEKYHKKPSIWSEYFYDQVYIAARAIETGEYTGDNIRLATRNVCATFIGASGSKQLDNENYVRWSFDWIQWQANGTFLPITPGNE
jgi:ABC-type branched-subunit amino acid transport system substrate-binding protein